jgi:hypothetical protein
MYGIGGRNSSMKDIRHCWPNIKKNVVQPLLDNNNQVDVLLSTYKVTDETIEKDIFDKVQPKHVLYWDTNNSTPLTCKFEPLEYMYSLGYDFYVMTRSDIHFNKSVILDTLRYDKFNFLFPEKDVWKNKKYCSDNLYLWPKDFTPYLKQSITEAKRKNGLTHTHDIYTELCSLIGENNLNIMSNEEEFSDVNSFYSLCRPGLDKLHLLNPEVKERFYK